MWGTQEGDRLLNSWGEREIPEEKGEGERDEVSSVAGKGGKTLSRISHARKSVRGEGGASTTGQIGMKGGGVIITRGTFRSCEEVL